MLLVPLHMQTNIDQLKSCLHVYVTFVVDNTDEVFEIAKAEKFEVLSEPAATFYGQRRLLL